MNNTDCFKKRFIFITGAPRSGTSLITKVIDAHPDIVILMENIFGNRRRHWQRELFWNSPETLRKQIENTFSQFSESIIGNKVITPDVWNADDIAYFCGMFQHFKLIFIVRDPVNVALSRIKREPEDFLNVFNEQARQNMPLDFRSRFHTYISSWQQGIEIYRQFKKTLGDDIKLVYYEDFCTDFENQIKNIFDFLTVPFSENVLKWNEFPHHNAEGKLVKDLKYPDTNVFINHPPESIPEELKEALKLIPEDYELWKTRKL